MRKRRHRRRQAVVAQMIQKYPPGTLAFRHGDEIPGRTVLRHLCTDEVSEILRDRTLHGILAFGQRRDDVKALAPRRFAERHQTHLLESLAYLKRGRND